MHKSLGELLKKLRSEQHLTQSQVASKLGITRQAYAYYEKSNSIPDLNTILKLAALYEIPLHVFLDYYPPDVANHLAESTPYSTHPQSIYPDFLNFYSQQENMKKYHYLNRSEKELLFMFQKLSESEQHEFLRLAYFKSFFLADKHSNPSHEDPE